MIGRRAALAGIGLLGAVGASAQELSPLLLHPPARQSASAVGLASWYGREFHGHMTADGETFDMRALSAAHRTMPLPSYARVTNLANGRSVIVRVNDRGPFVGGRMLDVSARVADLLEFNHAGVAKIRLDYVGKAPPAGSDGPALLASLRTGGAPVVAAVAPLAGANGPVRPASLRTGEALAFAAPSPLAGSNGLALLVSLRTGDAPAAAPAPPLDEGETVVARSRGIELRPSYDAASAPPAPARGETVVARLVERPRAAEPPSPYGELIAYPFSPYGQLIAYPFVAQAAQP
ncbi:septal ring lytic transglycosylase RlpA family protein [Methylocapsa sp. S129]|uniref:septal ring lytic transglycosylase RlpA family protein n=1 Tax=Methylocapsa sp. S129 TaxID=1641869 RepID=UPI00131DF0EF|nr:septal ring lytic transglycosylase RlpA family protein [Methylocapsa sp. S129]